MEDSGITEFREEYEILREQYEELSIYVEGLSEHMRQAEHIPGHVQRRPGGMKTLDSAIKTLEGKGRRFPTLNDVINELDDLAAITIATTTKEDFPIVEKWIADNFIEAKPTVTKPRPDEKPVYKTDVAFTPYSGRHFKVRLSPELAAGRTHLSDKIVEIQLKSEHTAVVNRTLHPNTYKNIVPLSAPREGQFALLSNLMAVTGQMQELGIDWERRKGLPFQSSHKVFKILLSYGLKMSSIKFLGPLWIALQVSSLDTPDRLHKFCQGFPVPGPGLYPDLFGHDEWKFTSRLRRDLSNHVESTADTVAANPAHLARYRAWVLANTFVGLHCLGMDYVTQWFLITCGYMSALHSLELCARLLVFLPHFPNANESSLAPSEDDREFLNKLWAELKHGDNLDMHLQVVVGLVETGVYPRLRYLGRSHNTSTEYVRTQDWFQIFWPAVLGSPPKEHTRDLELRPDSEPEPEYFPSDIVYVPRLPSDSEVEEGRWVDWVKLVWGKLSEHWEWTTIMPGRKIEANQRLLTAYCCTFNDSDIEILRRAVERTAYQGDDREYYFRQHENQTSWADYSDDESTIPPRGLQQS